LFHDPLGNLDGFYFYGPTDDNSESHWFTQPVRSISAALTLLGDVQTDGQSTNAAVIDNCIEYVFTLTDGQAGDNDLQANGEIQFSGAPSEPNNGSTGGSSGGCWFDTLLE
jgi:hypothetical protein